jgi:hypothetical protein
MVKSVVEDYIPLSAGFDSDVRFRSAFAQTTSYFDPFITIDNSQVIHHVGEHLTAVLTDYAIDFVEENAAGPFFLQLWHWAPHSPIEPPLEWAALYPNTPEGQFAALLSDADEEVGRLLDTLDTLGIADNTLVFITSDNGGVSNSHGSDPDSEPSHGELRGFKGQMYEGGMRVPVFARWPGMITPDSTNDSVAICMDFFPTAVELAGADISSLGLPGKSLVNMLLGATESREPLFWELKAQHQYYDSPDDIFDDIAVRQDDWKLVRADDQVMLFDLATDIGEQNDVAAANPTNVSDLLAQQSAWRLAEGLISHEIDVIQGDVVVDGDVITFGGANGAVTFVQNDFYDVQKSDFSFLVSITPTPTPPATQLLARKGKSWELWRLHNGRIRLVVHGTDGSRTVLHSNALTQPGQRHDVAFTVFGWKGGNSTVRLYFDGELEEETSAIPEVRSSGEPLRLGSLIGLSSWPFAGTMENLGFYSVALRPLEIDDLFAQ